MAYAKNTNKKKAVTLVLCGILSALVLFVAVAASVHAQFADVSLGVTPQYPKANEDMSATLTSLSFDLNRVKISWYTNGVLQKSGVGEKNFSFAAPAYGKRTTVEAAVEAPDGTTLRRNTAVVPQEVNVLWQAHTYTPPFYKGAALLTSRGSIIVTAFPDLISQNDTKISPQNVIYEWEQDGVSLGSLSGFGKRSIVLGGKTTARSQTTVSVTVSSLDGDVRGKETISIRTGEPRILLYEKHPLRGVKIERALRNSYNLETQEIILRAEPYFFSLDDIASDALRIKWSLNDSLVSAGEKELAVRKSAEKSGTSRVSIDILNTNKILQDARAVLNINFN